MTCMCFLLRIRRRCVVIKRGKFELVSLRVMTFLKLKKICIMYSFNFRMNWKLFDIAYACQK